MQLVWYFTKVTHISAIYWSRLLIFYHLLRKPTKSGKQKYKNDSGNFIQRFWMEVFTSVRIFTPFNMALVQDCGRTTVSVTEDSLSSRWLAVDRSSCHSLSLWRIS